MGSNRAMFLFRFEVDGVNHSSFGKILTNLASFLTQFSSATDYRCFEFLHFFFAKNNGSAIQESAFVESAINELLSLECILEVHATPVVMNPLSVSIQNSGKKEKKRKKSAWFWISVTLISTSLSTSLDAKMFSVARGCWTLEILFSFDFKFGNHHVEVFPYHRQYFSFSRTFSFEFTRYFQFEVSLFGLSSAPYLLLGYLW